MKGFEGGAKLLTVKEAAGRLGISCALVYSLVQLRKIRHERHGLKRGTIRISEQALDEYRTSREVGTTEVAPPHERRGRLKHIRMK